MKIKTLLLCICFLFIGIKSFADSPLTSTPFYKGYLNIAIINEASHSDGKITEKQLQFLTIAKNPIAVKLALINSLGSNPKGKSNASKYLKFLFDKQPRLNHKNFINKATADELICYAYLKAMDNYFSVDVALQLINLPKLKKEKSLTIQLIRGLIQVQLNLGNSRYQIYNHIQKIQFNKNLNHDLNAAALKIIFEYINLYR